MVIQCKNLVSLYILPDQRRVNLLVVNKNVVFKENRFIERQTES